MSQIPKNSKKRTAFQRKTNIFKKLRKKSHRKSFQKENLIQKISLKNVR